MQYIKGPLLLLGGAGSGKTSLLVHKVAWLIRDLDTPPDQIRVITANTHAARLLRARVADLIGYQLPDLQVGTFAELGLALIEQRLDALGLRPGFSLYDRTDSEALIGRLLHETRPQLGGLTRAIARQIVQWKHRGIEPPAASETHGSSTTETAAWLWQRYEQRLRMANAIDLDDLACKAADLLLNDATLRHQWQNRTRFLLIDEYERVTAAEHSLAMALVGTETLLTAAGDEHQAIDDAAAGGHSVARLQSSVKDLRVIRLERNLRSNPSIARAAALLASAQRPGRDQSAGGPRETGRRLVVLQTRSEQDEADSIVSAIVEQKGRFGLDYRDFAVLLPKPEQAAIFERALQAQRIPCYSRSTVSLFAQTEVRDLWCYLRLLCNPADDIAFLRAINTPRRDIDRAALDQLLQFAAERGRPLLDCALDADLALALTPERFSVLREVAALLKSFGGRVATADPVALVHELIEALQYAEWLLDACNDIKIADDRMQNALALVARLRRLSKQQPGAHLRSLVTRLALNGLLEPDAVDVSVDGVALIPLAAAKGLEFKHVYVVGFEEGLLPAAETERDLQTERRRAYVAIGCARDSVTFSVTEQRRYVGDAAPRRRSRFLAELPQEDIEWKTAGRDAHAEALLGQAAGRIDRLMPHRSAR